MTTSADESRVLRRHEQCDELRADLPPPPVVPHAQGGKPMTVPALTERRTVDFGPGAASWAPLPPSPRCHPASASPQCPPARPLLLQRPDDASRPWAYQIRMDITPESHHAPLLKRPPWAQGCVGGACTSTSSRKWRPPTRTSGSPTSALGLARTPSSGTGEWC